MTGTDTTGATTTTTDVATTTGSAATTEQVVEAPDVAAPILSAENPGMLASAVIGTRVYTTNQPSTAVFTETEMTERPADWADIAQVDDIVFNSNGDVVGYIADIGGFLGWLYGDDRHRVHRNALVDRRGMRVGAATTVRGLAPAVASFSSSSAPAAICPNGTRTVVIGTGSRLTTGMSL